MRSLDSIRWCLVIISLVLPVRLFAQNVDPQQAVVLNDTAMTPAPKIHKTCLWLEGGLGVGSCGAAGNLNLTCQFNKHVFSAGIDATAAPSSDVAGDAGEIFVVYLTDIGQSRSRYFALGAGIGYVISGMENAIGIPIQVQYSTRPLSFAGIGIHVFGNVNRVKPYFCITFCLQLGKVR